MDREKIELGVGVGGPQDYNLYAYSDLLTCDLSLTLMFQDRVLSSRGNCLRLRELHLLLRAAALAEETGSNILIEYAKEHFEYECLFLSINFLNILL